MMITTIINAIALIIGATIGLTFADIDLAPPLPIRHRSFWTHGAIIPWLISLFARQHPLAWWFAAGFLPAFALHLLADCLPKKWQGGALISLFPLGGWRLPAPLSLLWIAGGVAAAGYLWWEMVGPYVLNVIGR